MVEPVQPMNPAEEASQRALDQVHRCLEHGESFLVEAGAGAGKTYTLVKALQFLIDRYRHTLPQRHQRIACITFTNVAKDEIEARTDRSPLIHCNTIHAFCWSLIVGFQRQLRERLPELEHWPERLAEAGDLGDHPVAYELGHRGINDARISIHHDDVLLLTIALMEHSKFRRILADKYPIILIDEYQDTDGGWIDSIKQHFLGREDAPQFGFFGDHWQKIYGNGCGQIEHPGLTVVGKEANFRSVPTVVDCLNRMRPAAAPVRRRSERTRQRSGFSHQRLAWPTPRWPSLGRRSACRGRTKCASDRPRSPCPRGLGSVFRDHQDPDASTHSVTRRPAGLSQHSRDLCLQRVLHQEGASAYRLLRPDALEPAS